MTCVSSQRVPGEGLSRLLGQIKDSLERIEEQVRRQQSALLYESAESALRKVEAKLLAEYSPELDEGDLFA